MGVKAVESLLEGKANLMVGIIASEMVLTPIDDAVRGHTKIDRELIRVSDIMTI
jgi:6-phosphofructokinase 1